MKLCHSLLGRKYKKEKLPTYSGYLSLSKRFFKNINIYYFKKYIFRSSILCWILCVFKIFSSFQGFSYIVKFLYPFYGRENSFSTYISSSGCTFSFGKFLNLLFQKKNVFVRDVFAIVFILSDFFSLKYLLLFSNKFKKQSHGFVRFFFLTVFQDIVSRFRRILFSNIFGENFVAYVRRKFYILKQLINIRTYHFAF